MAHCDCMQNNLPYFYSFYLQSQMNQIWFFELPSNMMSSLKKKYEL